MANRRRTDELATLAQCQHASDTIPEHAALVPLDGSPAAARIVPVVQTIASRLHAPVRLLAITEHAAQPARPLATAGLPARVVALPFAIPPLESPADTIIREARQHKSRLIALSAHSHALGSEHWLGHVTQEILRRAPCSVLVVRPEISERYAQDHPSLARILLPLDGAPSTAAVMAREELRGWVRALKPGRGPGTAEEANATALEVLHVVTQTAGGGEAGTMMGPYYMDQPYHEWQSWTREFLARFCTVLDYEPLDVIVRVGDPGREIVRVAQERQSDLVMMSWKGELDGGRAAAVETVLRHAPCPVLFTRIRKPRS